MHNIAVFPAQIQNPAIFQNMTVIGDAQGSSDILLYKQYGHLLIGIDLVNDFIDFLDHQRSESERWFVQQHVPALQLLRLHLLGKACSDDEDGTHRRDRCDRHARRIDPPDRL